MNKPKDNFFIGRIKSVKHALRGMYLLLTTEHSVMVQFTIAIVVTIVGFIMKISAVEWMFQCMAIGLVITAEALNTGIEKLCDFIHIEHHKNIKFIKDIAAGAVAFAAIMAAVIGLIIYIPKFV